MQKLILLDKPIGSTPLQCIEQFVISHPEYAKEKLGYAGRLDPMAEGLLLVLVGEENKKRKAYEALPKTYEFSVLFGVATDTYDVMGKIISSDMFSISLESRIKKILSSYIGKKMQPYPHYSSRTVKGKPLYYWAREGKLGEIEIPEKEREIYDLQYLSSTTISAKDLFFVIRERIQKVKGSFRQKEILDGWKTFLANDAVYPLLHFSVSCSSGTYVRSLAEQMGIDLGVSSLAFSIRRVKVGDYTISARTHSTT